MKIVTDSISLDELTQMATKMFGGLVKAVVDVEKGIMVVDTEMHADQEKLLLDQGSEQENLWGINLYPNRVKSSDWIVFGSMMNVRPGSGNRSRGVEDPAIQEKIRVIVTRLVTL